MKKRTKTKLASFFYSIFRIGQGLLFHPYQTMQSLVRQPVFGWLVFLPLFFWGMGKILWHVVFISLGRWLVSPLFGTGFLSAFIVHWVTYFCFIWQLILMYLLIRFFWAFWEGNKRHEAA